MLYHTGTWNPPPFCTDYKIGASTGHDPWSGLSALMTLLARLDTNKEILQVVAQEDSLADFEVVRLQEDITLAGFTPLMYNVPEPIFTHKDRDMEEAQNALRVQKLIFFGTGCLCKCDPPVLRKTVTTRTRTSQAAAGEVTEELFESVVQNRIEGSSDSEILLESFSEDEGETSVAEVATPKSTKANCDQAQQQSKRKSGQKEPAKGQDDESRKNNNNNNNNTSSNAKSGSSKKQRSSGNANSSNNNNNNSSSNNNSSPSTNSANNNNNNNSEVTEESVTQSSQEIRKLLRRKDELERRQKMQERYSERLQVSRDF
ncbi:hypothetical protein pipiens_015156 [Culex pipiens pipiens]|uniref:Uncharacterized protein n=1 Tax=Culex pipiens pipiens TaxID=38569 RepID=A0ABD1CRU2_CULPP